MADHNFLTDTYDANTSVLDECKSHIATIVLPTEPASQFEDDDVVVRAVVDAINATLGDVSETFESQAYMYRFAQKGVCLADTDYTAKLTDPFDDIRQLITTLNGMTETMNVSHNTGVTFLEDENCISISDGLTARAASGIAAIKLSDYVTVDENGNYEYNNAEIDSLFSEMKNGAIPEENYYIIEMILYSCVTENSVNTDEIAYIMNSSKNMVVVSNEVTATHTDIGWDHSESTSYNRTIKYNKGMLNKFWKRVSSDMCLTVSDLMYSNTNILDDSNYLGTDQYRILVNLNSLADIVTAYCEYSTTIEQNYLSELESEDHLRIMEENPNTYWYELEHGAIGLINGEIDDYVQKEKERIMGYKTDVSISYTPYDTSDSPDLTVGNHYTLTFGESNKAFIYEFSENTNETLTTAVTDLTKHTATEILKSFKYDLSDYSNADEYAKKKYTTADKVRVGLDVIECVPVVGKYLTIADHVTETGIDMATEYGKSGDDRTAKSEKDVIDSLSSVATDTADQVSGYGKDINKHASDQATKHQGKEIEDGGKYAKVAIKGGTKLVDAQKHYEALKEEYEEKVQYNKTIDGYIAQVNESEAEDLIKQIKKANKKPSGSDQMQFSFTVHTNQKVVVSDIKIEDIDY